MNVCVKLNLWVVSEEYEPGEQLLICFHLGASDTSSRKSLQLNAGISIVLHFTMNVGQWLFHLSFFILASPSPFLNLFLFGNPVK